MPTTYTHYKFGKDVYASLPASTQDVILAHRQLYDIGLHGPDILFYYKLLIPNPTRSQGYHMHKQKASIFFERSKKVLEGLPEKESSLAYLYGFICHFALDSQCHSYIEKIIQVSGLSHAEIEMELDRFLLVQDGIQPVRYISSEHIVPSKENAAVIAPFFLNVNQDTVQKVLHSMINCLKLLRAPNTGKRLMLYCPLRVAGQHKTLYKMVISKKPNPMCEEYCLFLKELYDQAVTLAATLILQYQESLNLGTPLNKRFEWTFGAGEHWQELVVPKI